MNELRTVSFYCVGTQKAGTTTLHDILVNHPDIYLPPKKEAHFFDREERFRRGIEWYFSEFFSDYSGETCVGSFTPEYMYYSEVPERIFKAFGKNIKLLFIFRNPAERSYSHYLMTKRRGLEPLAFKDAIKNELSRISIDENSKMNYSYVQRGYYAEQVERYLKYFDINNMLFLIFENDIKQNLKNSINRIQQFLEVEVYDLNCDKHSNPATYVNNWELHNALKYPKPKLKKFFSAVLGEKLARKLRNFVFNRAVLNSKKKDVLPSDIEQYLINKVYYDDIKRLEKITGLDLSTWEK